MIKNKFFPGQRVYFLTEWGYRSPQRSGVIATIHFYNPDAPFIAYDINEDKTLYSRARLWEGVSECRIFATEGEMYEYLDGLISAEINRLEEQRHELRLSTQEAKDSNE